MMVYKIKHIPTGRFYQPVVGGAHRKTNISDRGKIYEVKPTLGRLNNGYNVVEKNPEFGKSKRWQPRLVSLLKKFVESEWKVITYEMVETE